MKTYTLHDVAEFADTFGVDFFAHFDLTDDNFNPYVYRDIDSSDGYMIEEYLQDDIFEEMYNKRIIITSDDVIASFFKEKMRNGCHYILEVSWFFTLDEQLKNYIVTKANSNRDGKLMLVIKHIDDVEA